MDRAFVKEWLTKYKEKFGGYIPKDLDAYLDSVDRRHEKIRKILGGWDKTVNVEIKESGQRPANIDEVTKLLSKVLVEMPNYFTHYCLTYQDFLYPKIARLRNISPSKHIVGYATRSKLDDDKRKRVGDIAAELGELYKREQAKECGVFVTLSTNPIAFARIGRYGCGYSCFAQGSMNDDKKFAVSLLPHSFVLLVQENGKVDLTNHGDEFSKKDWETSYYSDSVFSRWYKSQCVKSRAFGFHDQESVFTFNYAGGGSTAYRTTASNAVLENMARQIFGFENPAIGSVGRMCGGIGGSYGRTACCTIYEKDKVPEEKQYVIPLQCSKEKYGDRRDCYVDGTMKEPDYDDPKQQR